MKNLAVLLIFLCPLALNTCDNTSLDMDDFPAIEWEMKSVYTDPRDASNNVSIWFQPSRDFEGKNIAYYEDYSDTQQLLNTNRLVYINGKSPSGRGGGVYNSSHSLIISPDEPLKTGDMITFYRDWFVMKVFGKDFQIGKKAEWYKVRIITESLIVP
jgi:beta-lactamase class D